MDHYERLDLARFTSRAPASRGTSWGIVIIRYSLAVVALWFGANEVFAPKAWTIFVPSFVGIGTLAMGLVITHGILLAAIGLALVTGYYYRIAAIAFALVLLEIIVSTMIRSGLSDMAIGGIGIFGSTLSLVFII